MLNIYLIDEMEYVAAKNSGEAKEFYENTTGEKIEKVVEANIDKEKIGYLIDEIDTLDKITEKLGINELKITKGSLGCEYGWHTILTFREILQLEDDGENKPYIFASTEC